MKLVLKSGHACLSDGGGTSLLLHCRQYLFSLKDAGTERYISSALPSPFTLQNYKNVVNSVPLLQSFG